MVNNKSTNFIIGFARLSLDENAKVKKCSNLFDSILKKNKNKIKFNSEVEKFEKYKNLTKVYLQNKKYIIVKNFLYVLVLFLLVNFLLILLMIWYYMLKKVLIL